MVCVAPGTPDGAPAASASRIAWRSEPEPESLLLLTTNCAFAALDPKALSVITAAHRYRRARCSRSVNRDTATRNSFNQKSFEGHDAIDFGRLKSTGPPFCRTVGSHTSRRDEINCVDRRSFASMPAVQQHFAGYPDHGHNLTTSLAASNRPVNGTLAGGCRMPSGRDFRYGSKCEILAKSRCFLLCLKQQTSLGRVGRYVRCLNGSGQAVVTPRTSAFFAFSSSSSGLLNAGALRTQGKPRLLLRRAGG